MLGRLLLVILVEMLVVGAVVALAVLRPGPWSATAVAVVALGGIVVLAAAAFHLVWRPMVADFPWEQPAPDAVRRRFQSIGFGIVNLGASVHLAADEEYMHIEPLMIWQALGASPASIPWSVMQPVGTSGRVVRVNGRRLDGPRWCLSLADDDAEA